MKIASGTNRIAQSASPTITAGPPNVTRIELHGECGANFSLLGALAPLPELGKNWSRSTSHAIKFDLVRTDLRYETQNQFVKTRLR